MRGVDGSPLVPVNEAMFLGLALTSYMIGLSNQGI